MRTHPPKLPLRITALVAVVASAAFTYSYREPSGALVDVRTISERYDHLLAPAPYAFLVWGIIDLALVAYAAIALLPGQSRIALHDRIAPPLIAASVLRAVWLVSFTEQRFALALAVMGGLLVAAVLMYRRVTAALHVGPQRRSWLVPFSLFLAWISVAAVLDVTTTLVAYGAHPKSVPWAVLMLGALVALGLTMAMRFRDVVFPAVVAWASLAVAVRSASSSETLATLAMIGSFVSVMASAALLILRVEQTFGLGVPIAASAAVPGLRSAGATARASRVRERARESSTPTRSRAGPATSAARSARFSRRLRSHALVGLRSVAAAVHAAGPASVPALCGTRRFVRRAMMSARFAALAAGLRREVRILREATLLRRHATAALASRFGGEVRVLREAALPGRDALPALATGLRREVRILREAPVLGGHALAALARDLALPRGVHRREAAMARRAPLQRSLFLASSRHDRLPLPPPRTWELRGA